MNEIFNSQKIIDKYADMIYRIANSYLENKADAEDIVQEVFIQYINYIKTNNNFKDSEHEKCWLIRVTINLCYNENKSARITKTVPLTECKFMATNNIDEDFLFENLNKLKDKYRVVFELFYFEDLKISQISKILKISQANVKTRLRRARNELKKKICEIGGEYSANF